MSKVLQSKYDVLTPLRQQVVRHALKAAFGMETCLWFRVGYLLEMVQFRHIVKMSDYQARVVFKLLTGTDAYDIFVNRNNEEV